MHPEIAEEAKKIHYKQVKIYPKRGMILDRNGKVLAMSIGTYSVAILTKYFNGYDKISEIAEILNCSKNELRKKVKSKKKFIWIADKVNKRDARKLRKWFKSNGVKGILIEEDEKRYYPHDC